jgi:hypothetical protein
MRVTSEDAIRALRAEALFVASLQPSEEPSPAQVRQAVGTNLLRYGPAGCAARMARQYGDHPIEAVNRMRWVLDRLTETYPTAAAGARRNIARAETTTCTVPARQLPADRSRSRPMPVRSTPAVLGRQRKAHR